VSETPVASATRDFGGLLRERRDTLGRTAADLARATSVPRTYIHDCEAGRKWPNRAWVERLAALDPPDPELLERYDECVLQRTVAIKAPFGQAAARLAEDLTKGPSGKDATGPRIGRRDLASAGLPAEFKAYAAYAGRAKCLEAAMALLSLAGECPPETEVPAADERFHGLLTVDSPSVERSEFGWVAALRDALDNGWTVVHLLAPEDDPRRRMERVQNLLSLVGRQQAYHPMVPARPSSLHDAARHQSLETIAVPGIGVLQLYPAAEAASFFPWRDDFIDACRQIALAAHTVQAASVPLVTEYQAESIPLPADEASEADSSNERFKAELLQLPSKIAYDTVVTEAVVRGGRRAVIKGGFVLACMPANSTLEFSLRLKRRAANVGMATSIPLLELLTQNRQKRRDAMRQFPGRDICTEEGLRRYLDPQSAGFTRHQQHDLLTGELTFADRVAHVNGVIDLLQSSPNYEVALLPAADLVPIRVGPWYWMATETALFYVGPVGDAGTRYVIIRDAAVVDAFFQFVDSCWESFDHALRDRPTVIARLHEIVAEAKEAHASRHGCVTGS
jgi:hypothetical protein